MGYDEFAAVSGSRLRAGLVAAYGPEAGVEAASEALAWASQHWGRLAWMENPVGHLYRFGQTAAPRTRRPQDFLPVPSRSAMSEIEPWLADALEQLTERQRVVVVMVHGLDWPEAQVAELLDVTPAMVYATLARALANVKRARRSTPMTTDVEPQIAAYARWIEQRAGVPLSQSAATTSTTSTSTVESSAEESGGMRRGSGSGDGGESHRLRWVAVAACALIALGGLVLLGGRSASEPTVSANQAFEPTEVATTPAKPDTFYTPDILATPDTPETEATSATPDTLATSATSATSATLDTLDTQHTVNTRDTSATPDTLTTPDTISIPGRGSWVTRTLDPDGDASTPLRVTYQVPPTTDGSQDWFGWVKYLPGDADGVTALSIVTVSNLVTDACLDHTPLDPPVGPSVDDLATALSQLAPFDVMTAPTDVTLFGHQGKHLELTVPALPVSGAGDDSSSKNFARFTDCYIGELYSWISPINNRSWGLLARGWDSHGAFNAYQTPGQTEEFWILDVEGTRLVLVSFDTPGAPAHDVAVRDAVFESILIEP